MPHDSILSPAGLPRLPAAVRAALQRLRARLRRAYARWHERRLQRDTYRSLCELDDRTLHDLGFDRSELWPAMRIDDPTRMPRISAGGYRAGEARAGFDLR
jgi:uncharacterized protein YjiS (DUF1127 family)